MEQETLTTSPEETQTLEEREFHNAEALYESFFGEGTEEEQLRIRELAAKLNVRDNDALWIIIYVLNYFGRFYRDLPEKLKAASTECFEAVQKTAAEVSESERLKAQIKFSETLTKSTQEILERHKKRAWVYELFMPLAWSCMGVFCLCLISFVAGSAVAGKGWGHSPLTALLNAPAGWIVPLALIPMGGFALYRGLIEQGRTRFFNLLAALLSGILAFGILFHIL